MVAVVIVLSVTGFQTTDASKVANDIIFSGGGQACPYDDDEDGCSVYESSTDDDDIIKPNIQFRKKLVSAGIM